jgi:hypothetical protein
MRRYRPTQLSATREEVAVMVSTRTLWSATPAAVSGMPMRGRGHAAIAVETHSTALGVAQAIKPQFTDEQYRNASNGGVGATRAWSPPV